MVASQEYNMTIQAPGCALGSTTDQTCVLKPYEGERDGQFVECVGMRGCDTLPDTSSLGEEGCVSMSPVIGQVATKPDLDGGYEEENVAEDTCQVTPSTGKKGRARFRGGVEEDDLLDRNSPSSRMEMNGDSKRDQETNDPGQNDVGEGQEALMR